MKPILFNTDMVRAILDGRKTQSRRVVKPQPVRLRTTPFTPSGIECVHGYGVKPRYAIGDILWVRETWCAAATSGYDAPDDGRKIPVWYRATDEGLVDGRWRPSIHMPFEFARIFLKVTGVGVERLQEIDDAGAIAEGSYLNRCDCGTMNKKTKTPLDVAFTQTWCHIHGTEFKSLWDSIFGTTYPWDSNPWVFVYKFERIEK